MKSSTIFPVGGKVEIRNAEWRILSAEMTKSGGQLLKCEGLSQIVRGRVCYFFTLYEKDVTLLLPENTKLVADPSPQFIESRLYIETVLRTAPHTENDKIYVAHKAAMDPLPYQFDPTLQALNQPRPRILIADAVGIGKTLEAGILTSELIARGRAKRILVLATKAVLPQFQQEFWNRFSIPLTALDSAGIQRVRDRIPSNQNPFNYFDKSIISIDTLKQNELYRDLLSQAHWDLIIIDEAHNVAQRTNHSQRAKLAQLLSSKSDAMILLTATPHDGRPETFASLLNILDPTAIVNPSHYTPKDYAAKGLVIRRFKNDIKSQFEDSFPERKISVIETSASDEENEVLKKLETFLLSDEEKAQEKEENYGSDDKAKENSNDSSEKAGKQNSAGKILFSTTLLKAFFSSPAACLSVIENRIRRIKDKADSLADSDKERREKLEDDISELKGLKDLVDKVKPENFSKLQVLAGLLKADSEERKNHAFNWDPKKADDRLVIFTESVKTLEFLKKQLPKLSGLDEGQLAFLDGSMNDSDIAKVVNDFNKESSKYRILVASDVASEGINLHHLAHRMIHFDIPWSLMVFQQRNGRIDRYGQKKQPEIYYLQTRGTGKKSQGDCRVLEKLIEKDKQVQTNLEDPLEFLSQKEQEDKTAEAIQNSIDSDAMSDEMFFLGADFGAEPSATETAGTALDTSDTHKSLARVLTRKDFEKSLAKEFSLFKSDLDYVSHALAIIGKLDNLKDNELTVDEKQVSLQPPVDLKMRLKYLPPEILPEDNHFVLTSDRTSVMQSMTEMRNAGKQWSAVQLLWPNHPVVEWLEGRLLNVFGRNTAPVLYLNTLEEGEHLFLLQGGYPNRRGYIPVYDFIVVRIKEDSVETLSLGQLIKKTGLASEEVVNTGRTPDIESLNPQLPQAIELAEEELKKLKETFVETEKPKLDKSEEELANLLEKHKAALEKKSGSDTNDNDESVRENARLLAQRTERLAFIEKQIEAAKNFQRNNFELEGRPYLQVIAVFTGSFEEAAAQ